MSDRTSCSWSLGSVSETILSLFGIGSNRCHLLGGHKMCVALLFIIPSGSWKRNDQNLKRKNNMVFTDTVNLSLFTISKYPPIAAEQVSTLRIQRWNSDLEKITFLRKCKHRLCQDESVPNLLDHIDCCLCWPVNDPPPPSSDPPEFACDDSCNSLFWK